ncbi:MAG: hypothetical protein FWB99_00305 [Treponema sp.]|nr:hypothetical protein [Treponema sp.]
MRIDNTLPAFYIHLPQNTVLVGRYAPAAQPENLPPGGVLGAGIRPQRGIPGVVVDISPEGWAAYRQSREAEEGRAMDPVAAMEELRCAACDSRRYQDSSDDPSVSFQMPTHISPEQSAAKVRAHEYEHVANEQARADREGRRVISQTVTLHSAICPECGRVYTSGGVTRTITAEDHDHDEA